MWEESERLQNSFKNIISFKAEHSKYPSQYLWSRSDDWRLAKCSDGDYWEAIIEIHDDKKHFSEFFCALKSA